MNKKLLFELMELPGVSGEEHKIAEIIEKHAKKYNFEIVKDNLGSIFALKKSNNKDAKTILIDAHMDEVGFIVMGIKDNGFIEIDAKGGIWKHSLAYQRLRVWDDNAENSYSGVVSFNRPPLPNSAPSPIPDIDKLLVDIGASSKEEVEKLGISVGNQITFDTKIEENGNRIIGKAIDDRAGIALIIELMEAISHKDYEFNVLLGGTVQEEVGLRGARTITYKTNPDLAITVDVSASQDIPAKSSKGSLGEGTILRHKDAYTITPKRVIIYLEELFKKNKIKYQDYFSQGGTNAGIIHMSGEGIITVPLGILARNLHTGSSVMDKRDYEETSKALQAMLDDLTNKKIKELKGE